MNHDQIQQEISIIKSMIEKTRRETAESGHFLILIGIVSVIGTFAIGMFKIFNLNYMDLPVMILMLVINGLIGYFVVAREEQKEKVKTYTKSMLYQVWFGCGIAAIMILFLFPLTKVYSFQLVPVLVSMIMGIMIFSAGVIYELRYIQWCSIVWWGGACLMAYIESQYKFLIMIGIIILGFILPGVIFNRQYKNGSKKNEA